MINNDKCKPAQTETLSPIMATRRYICKVWNCSLKLKTNLVLDDHPLKTSQKTNFISLIKFIRGTLKIITKKTDNFLTKNIVFQEKKKEKYAKQLSNQWKV